jgi:hypothetical protein
MKKKMFPAPEDSSAERKRLKDSDAHKKHWMRYTQTQRLMNEFSWKDNILNAQ